MRKKVCAAGLCFLLAVALAGCFGTQFDGSRTGNDSRLLLDYKVLNTTTTQMLKLEKGDVILFDIVSEGGSLDIVLQKEGSPAAYECKDFSQDDKFEVGIPETGTYRCAVTGKHAKGSVHIEKQENA